MSPDDLATFKQAKQLAQSGDNEAAYKRLKILLNKNNNGENPDLLIWVALTCPSLSGAEIALSMAAIIDPKHPDLKEARQWLTQKKSRLAQAKNRSIFSNQLQNVAAKSSKEPLRFPVPKVEEMKQDWEIRFDEAVKAWLIDDKEAQARYIYNENDFIPECWIIIEEIDGETEVSVVKHESNEN